MASQHRRIPQSEQAVATQGPAVRASQVDPSRAPQKVGQVPSSASRPAGPGAPVPGVAGRATGPVQLDLPAAGDEGVAGEGEAGAAAAGGGGFFGWVGSLLGWGETGTLHRDEEVRAGDPEAPHGHATAVEDAAGAHVDSAEVGDSASGLRR